MVSVGVFTSFFLVGIVLRALTFYKKGIHFFYQLHPPRSGCIVKSIII